MSGPPAQAFDWLLAGSYLLWEVGALTVRVQRGTTRGTEMIIATFQNYPTFFGRLQDLAFLANVREEAMQRPR